jgi:hypothetical protein
VDSRWSRGFRPRITIKYGSQGSNQYLCQRPARYNTFQWLQEGWNLHVDDSQRPYHCGKWVLMADGVASHSGDVFALYVAPRITKSASTNSSLPIFNEQDFCLPINHSVVLRSMRNPRVLNHLFLL